MKTNSRTSFVVKLIICMAASMAIINIVYMLQGYLPGSWLPDFINRYSIFIEIAFSLIAGTFLSITWNRQEKQNIENSGIWEAYTTGVIRYWLAFSICIYGFAKVLKTQFMSPAYISDTVIGDMSGFSLTWYYFGFSYTLALIIGFFQIGGGILLLFRRTTLLGAMILLPIMINILLINVFYKIAFGALINSVCYTLGLTLILLLNYQKLKAVFLDIVEKLPPVKLSKSWVKHTLRVLIVAAAFFHIYHYLLEDTSDQKLLGVWNVKTFKRNNVILPDDAWSKDKTVFSKIYFSGIFGCAFSPNPYVFKGKSSLRGSYSFDESHNKLSVNYFSNGVSDSLIATVTERTDTLMTLSTIHKGDTLVMELAKERDVPVHPYIRKQR